MFSSLKYYLKVYKFFILRFALNIYNLFVEHSAYKGFKKTLQIAVNEIEYYHNKGPEIENFPFLDKFEVKEHQKDMCKHTWFSKKASTSGTTGTPIYIIRDLNSIAAEQYFLNKYYRWNNYYKVVFRGGRLFRTNTEKKRMYKK